MFGLSHTMASAPHVSRVKKKFCMCRDLYIYAPSSKHTPMISHVIGKRKCSAFSCYFWTVSTLICNPYGLQEPLRSTPNCSVYTGYILDSICLYAYILYISYCICTYNDTYRMIREITACWYLQPIPTIAQGLKKSQPLGAAITTNLLRHGAPSATIRIPARLWALAFASLSSRMESPMISLLQLQRRLC